MAGKGGGAWKVAYADFVTAMMAFFMVMWLIAQSDKVKQSVAKSFRNERGRFAPGDMLLPPRHEQYFKDRKPTTELGESPASVDAAAQSARKPLTLAINNGSRTAVGTAIIFSSQSTELDPAAAGAIELLLPSILGKPQKIEIRGHAGRTADSLQNKPGADPWSVSFARCVATSKFLQEKGVPPERIRLSQAGASEPYAVRRGSDTDTVEDRVEIFLLGETSEDAFGTRDVLQQRFKSPDAPNAGE